MLAMASPYRYRDGLARVGQAWHYRFRLRGTTHQGSTGLSRRADAVLWLRRYRDQLANGEMGLATAPSVKTAWEHWLEITKGKVSEAHRDRARRAFKFHILPVCGELSADAVGNDVVELIRTRYLEGESQRLRGGPRTQQGANTLLAYLRMVIRPLIKRGFLRVLPFDVKPLKIQQKVKVFLPYEKVEPFLVAVDRTANAHQQIAVRAMLRMGLREDEALGMRWEWFQGDLETYTPGNTKGKEAVALSVPDDLRELIRMQKSLSPWVIPAEPIKGKDGIVRTGPHRAQFTVKAILRGGVAVGIKGLTPHRMRGTCATLMHRRGVPIKTIQIILRHKKIETTMGYIEVNAEDIQNAMTKTWGAS